MESHVGFPAIYTASTLAHALQYGFPGNIFTMAPKPAIILLKDVEMIPFGHRSREQRIFVVIQAVHEKIFERGEKWNDA